MTSKVTALLICGHLSQLCHKKEADGFPYREILGFKQSYSPMDSNQWLVTIPCVTVASFID